MKTRLSIFIMSFLFMFQAAGNIFSQSFYEIKFKDVNGNPYTAFMVYNSESDAYMRIAYYNQGEYRVVNVEYTAKTGDLDDGTHYFVLYGENPTYVTDYSRGEQYNPDVFVWTWEGRDDFSLPYVTDDPDFKAESFSQCESYTELDPHNFTKDYLNQFYATDEADYLALMNMVDDSYNSYTNNDVNYNSDNYNNENSNYGGGLSSDLNSNNTNSDNGRQNNNNTDNNNTYNNTDNTYTNNNTNSGSVTMHLVIAANTAISDIGPSCEFDKKRMISEMESVADALGITLKQYIIDGKNLTRENVYNTLNNLTPGSNDIVLFFYTGHGFRWSNQQDQYSSMDFRYNPYTQISMETCMTVSEVSNLIASKGARLNISLADCCNSDIGVNAKSSEKFLTSKSDPNYDEKKLAKLFLNARGTIKSCAASPGEVSWCNESDGGFFMFSFFQAFHEEVGYLSTDPSWDDIMSNTKKYAQYKTSDGCSGCSAQNAVKSVSVTYN